MLADCAGGVARVGALSDLPVILVVEDDAPVQTIVEEALIDGGFEPAIAASGRLAVRAAFARGRVMAVLHQLRLFPKPEYNGNRPPVAHIKIVPESSLPAHPKCGSSFPGLEPLLR
jgi:hypothetical protein